VIEKQLLSDDVHARGKIILPPQNRASVAAIVGGVIQKIYVRKGQSIKRGQLLATYSSPDLINVQEDFINAKSQLDFLKKDYERQKTLKDKNINSDKDFQEIESEYQAAAGNYSACLAKIEMLNLDAEKLKGGEIQQKVGIVSPINGIVNEINVNIGTFAEERFVLFEIVDLSDEMLEIMVFEKDIHLVKAGQRVTFSPITHSGLIFEASVRSVGSMVEPDARVIKVIADIDEVMEEMIPGLFVSCEIHTSEDYLDALPESAVIIENDLDKYGFYTLDNWNSKELTFHRFDLKTGYVEDGYINVKPLNELPENAKVALTGVYYIKSEILRNTE
jgi:cobalt-zinc-cadmium efflux system membrane fusion protein